MSDGEDLCCHRMCKDRLDKWYAQLCDVHGLYFGSCVCQPPFRLFPFPNTSKDSEGRTRWTKLINRKTKGGRNWEPKAHDRVCSAHFRELEPTVSFPDPTQQLGYDLSSPSYRTKGKSLRKPPKPRMPLMKPVKRKLKSEMDETVDQQVTRETEDAQAGDTSMDPPDVASLPSSVKKRITDHMYARERQTECQCNDKDEELAQIRAKGMKLEQELRDLRNKKTGDRLCDKILKDNGTTKLFTGIETKDKFMALLSYLEPKVLKMRYWTGSKKAENPKSNPKGKTTPQKPGRARVLSAKAEFIMVLLKLRMVLTVLFLGTLFDVSTTTASAIFNTWIKFLASELGPLVYWPDKQLILENMPVSMQKKFKYLRCTLDCTEVFIGRPRELELQALTWSDYKKHNTIKFLVAIAPNGMITFISKAWGGRASDVHITRESGFLNLVEPGDVILADRGFTIREDLLLRQAKLHIPPPSKGREQQEPAKVAETKKIANARIHVERAIGRMKWFAILKDTLPVTLLPLADDIITVCAALVNLRSPLVKK